VARAVRRDVAEGVTEGTARRLREVYQASDGSLLGVGGKTGTGDNRFDQFAAGGRLISERVVDRTATFVFFLGDRFFGTITAYVPGAIAANYHFTSAIAVQLLKAIQPQLEPLLRSPPNEPAPSPLGASFPAAGKARESRDANQAADGVGRNPGAQAAPRTIDHDGG